MRKLGLIFGAGVLLAVVLFGVWIFARPEWHHWFGQHKVPTAWAERQDRG